MASITPTVLLLDLPDRALAGVDLLSFTTTPRFQGIRDLPAGWHFVFTSTISALSVRHGVWFHVKDKSQEPQIFVKKWDPAREELVQEKSQSDLLRWRANIGKIWQDRLTPYRQHAPNIEQPASDAGQIATVPESDLLEPESGDWVKLTNHLSSSLLYRITGVGQQDHWTLDTGSSATRDLEDIPGLTTNDVHGLSEHPLTFLPIDLKRTWRPEATGRERTDAARDRSWALNDLVDRHCKPQAGIYEILGEVQFCFVMVLTLNNYSCLEQWRRLLTLLFTSTAAVAQYPDFFVEFVATLRLQLQHCQDAEGGLIDLSDEGATLLKSLLRQFKRGLDDLSGPGKVRVVDQLDELEDFLREQYGWQTSGAFVKHGVLELEDGERVDMDLGEDDEDDETGEYAPVVVDLPDLRTGTDKPTVVDEHRSDSESEAGDLDEMDARY